MKLIRKPIVIVGLDPGTTIGYAILNVEGLLVKTGSARGASLHSIIEEITYYGKPVIVGTDKAKCPELVYQFAAKTGSRVVSPYADLLVAEKRTLASGFETGNDHEADALASALFAHKKYSAMLYKINSYLRAEGKENISDEVKKLIISSEGLSIGDAIKMVEKRQEPPVPVHNKEAPDEFSPTKEDYLRLKERLRKTESEYKVLKERSELISDELEKAGKGEEEDNSHKGGLASNKKINRVLRLREKNVKGLDKNNRKLIEKITLLKKFLAVSAQKLVLKRLDDLTYDEFLRRDKIISVREGDVLLVENPNKYNQKT
jgi:predicted RNase H-like nuclease (RuvC/YqgF family)